MNREMYPAFQSFVSLLLYCWCRLPNNTSFVADTRAITAMRQIPPADSSFPLYLHDGFDLNRFSEYVANRTDFVVQDHHSYFVFTPSDEAEPASQHTADVKGGIAESLYSASALQRRNLVVDEWSCALTDQSLDSESDPAQARKDFGTAQMEAYANATAGWSFWCKSTDLPPEKRSYPLT
jgi:glucan 1,3-beta-glucosidase